MRFAKIAVFLFIAAWIGAAAYKGVTASHAATVPEASAQVQRLMLCAHARGVDATQADFERMLAEGGDPASFMGCPSS